MNKIKFKKGQVSLTLTWFTATIVIFLIMLIFLIFTTSLRVVQDREILEHKNTKTNLNLVLEKRVEIEGKLVSVDEGIIYLYENEKKLDYNSKNEIYLKIENLIFKEYSSFVLEVLDSRVVYLQMCRNEESEREYDKAIFPKGKSTECYEVKQDLGDLDFVERNIYHEGKVIKLNFKGIKR